MKKRILVVAHEADVVETIPITLELAGHKVALADCGLDAILWAETLLPDLILVDASLPDMDGPTIIGILQRLPATAALGTMLLKPRWHNPPAQTRSGQPEIGSLNSSELLRQVAHALTLCHAGPPRNGVGAGEAGPELGVGVCITTKTQFASQTKTAAVITFFGNEHHVT